MSVFIFCSSCSFKTSNIVLHVYCCVAAVSSADRLVTLCSGLALAATVMGYLGCFFIPYVDSNYTISFATQLLGFSSPFCAITLIVYPTIRHCFLYISGGFSLFSATNLQQGSVGRSRNGAPCMLCCSSGG